MELDKAKEIHSSVLWEEVCKEIDVIVKAFEAELRTCSKDDLEKVQLKIQVWERVKRLPQDVIEREE